jgi:hypothetical protein
MTIRRALIATWTLALLVLLAPGGAAAIADPSFELLPAGTDLGTGTTLTPDLLTRWGIDSAIVVTAENGITPDDGLQMARANSGLGTDLYTLVDVSAMAADIDAGQLFADVSAFFNSVDPNEFYVSLRAFTGPFDIDPADQFGDARSETLVSDDDLSTWDQASLTGYQVPIGANYLALGVHTLFDVENPSYVDSAELTFSNVPEPAGPALLLCGAVALAGRRLAASSRTRAG